VALDRGIGGAGVRGTPDGAGQKFWRRRRWGVARRQEADVEGLMIDFYQAGSHENFYDELKRYLKSEG
jgi:hypothetical protein